MEWASDKHGLHQAVEEYYKMRNEDGNGPLLVSMAMQDLDLLEKKTRLLEARLRTFENNFLFRLFRKARELGRKCP